MEVLHQLEETIQKPTQQVDVNLLMERVQHLLATLLAQVLQELLQLCNETQRDIQQIEMVAEKRHKRVVKRHFVPLLLNGTAQISNTSG